MCSISFVSRKFFISSLISLLTHSLFNSMLFSLHVFECFWVFSLWLVSSFKPLWSEKMLEIFQFPWICWGLFSVLPCGLSLIMFHINLTIMNSRFFGVIVFVSIMSIWSRVFFNVTISFLILCLKDLSIVHHWVLKFPTMSVLLLISFLVEISRFP